MIRAMITVHRMRSTLLLLLPVLLLLLLAAACASLCLALEEDQTTTTATPEEDLPAHLEGEEVFAVPPAHLSRHVLPSERQKGRRKTVRRGRDAGERPGYQTNG